MPDYDNNFKEFDKKINDILYNKEIDIVKGDVKKVSDELKTIKTSMGDILNKLNDNKAEINEILNDLKEKKENFNFASNMASLTPVIRDDKRNGEDNAQIRQMQDDLDNLKHTLDSKLFEINIKLEMLSSNNTEETNLNKNTNEETKGSTGERSSVKLKTFGPVGSDCNIQSAVFAKGLLPSSIQKVTLPVGTTRIENDAFRVYSSLTSIVIPSSVTSIGSAAFRGCSSLTSIEIPSRVFSFSINISMDSPAREYLIKSISIS